MAGTGSWRRTLSVSDLAKGDDRGDARSGRDDRIHPESGRRCIATAAQENTQEKERSQTEGKEMSKENELLLSRDTFLSQLGLNRDAARLSPGDAAHLYSLVSDYLQDKGLASPVDSSSGGRSS